MSQTDRVLRMLEKRPIWGVKNYEFADANILRYSARIGELRKSHNISCERLYTNGKATGVFVYRLVQPEKQSKLSKVKLALEDLPGFDMRAVKRRIKRMQGRG